ncbi:hypothetical protein BGW37DRAFT_470384 [Umbelopsis sp. PMI_123]|nr:hypothetical protein BGW37DRAFT_470384 [Umbelopsis sp. PMI_123]
MRSMVMEWLTSNWDADIYCKLHITTQNFTMKSASRSFKFYSPGNNLAMYNNPDTHQYVYIPFNFDNTFGNGLEQDQGILVTGSYEEFHNDNGKIHSYLWEKLAKMPSFKAMYEGIAKDSLKTMFNSNALEPRINALAYMLQNETLWDISLERVSTGISRSWTGLDFLKNLDQGTGDSDLWYGLREFITLKGKSR